MVTSSGSSLLDLALLPVRPWTLPSVAERAPTTATILLGLLAFHLQGGLLVSSVEHVGGGRDMAPAFTYPSVAAYLWEVVLDAPIWGIGPTLLASGVIAVAALNLGSIASSEYRSPMARAYSRCLLLSHVALTVPILLWSLFAALSCAASPGCDFLAGKPEWLHSPIITVLGSMLPALPIALLYVGSAVYCWFKLRQSIAAATRRALP